MDKRHSKAGMLPARQNTVTAEVLCAMLEGRELTAIDSVFACSTTRLASVVHELDKRHGWRIERCNKPLETTDCRISIVTVYWLSPGVREAAFAAGAGTWVDEVIAKRRERRNSGTTQA
ncbi:hypothetical protein [Burkholderia dolosa]|uniref:hypothetical protein n=1 Tax=Burkholderia dolosa TaxID=152500 RepID=UPI001C9738DD|nr:hypothetical protein [Burkholderia dolosa]MBY4828697.1 hypothetical protein [Burkholderia dolosa]